MKTDSLFYFIFQAAPNIFFELIGQLPNKGKDYEFRSVEIKQTAFRIDGIFFPPKDAPNQTVYFAEVQFQKDQLLYRRFFAEIFLFLDQNPFISDWHAVIIYPKRSLEPIQTHLYRSLLTSPQVQQVYLNELGDLAGQSLGIGIVQLVVESEERAAAQAKRLIEQARQEGAGISPGVIIELIETILVYKFPQLSREEVEAMLGLSELKQTRVYQEALEEGRQEGVIAFVIRLLTRRLGTIDPELRSQIQQLSSSQLEELGEALMDFSSTDDLVTWLQSHS